MTVLMEPMGHKALKDYKVFLDRKDQQVLMAQLDLPDLQDHRGYKALLGRKDQLVQMAQLDLQGQ